jgi:hypothetical protein
LSPYVLLHVIHDVELIVSIILMLLEAREVDSMAEAVSLSVGVIFLDSAKLGFDYLRCGEFHLEPS